MLDKLSSAQVKAAKIPACTATAVGCISRSHRADRSNG